MTAANTQWAIVVQQIIGFNYPGRRAASVVRSRLQVCSSRPACVRVCVHACYQLWRRSDYLKTAASHANTGHTNRKKSKHENERMSSGPAVWFAASWCSCLLFIWLTVIIHLHLQIALLLSLFCICTISLQQSSRGNCGDNWRQTGNQIGCCWGCERLK